MHGILNLFNRLFLTARIKDVSLRRRELVLNVLLVSTLGVLILSAATLLIGYFVGFSNHVSPSRLMGIVEALAVVGALYVLSRLRYFFVAAYGLIGVYCLIATVMAVQWGINLALCISLFGLVIVLAGILLGASYSLYLSVLIGIIIFGLQFEIVHGHLHPNTYWQNAPPYLTDVIGYFFVFGMLAISSWLFNRQTDQALHQALRAEAALKRQKEMLEITVETRTRELRAAQMDKMQQLYRFAQLGQFSTSLMHDLANHLATLSIDIEGMAEKNKKHSQFLERAKQRITYIDEMVQWAYSHLHDKVQPKAFDVLKEIDEVLTIMRHNAQRADVQLHRSGPAGKKLTLYGDPNRFRQVIANLVSNAIDAYDQAPKHHRREVFVEVFSNNNSLLILVQDWGKGIPPTLQETIFEPFYSTKHSGTGIGLFVVKQIVEEYFGGHISLTSEDGKTMFSITLNKKSEPPKKAK